MPLPPPLLPSLSRIQDNPDYESPRTLLKYATKLGVSSSIDKNTLLEARPPMKEEGLAEPKSEERAMPVVDMNAMFL